MIRDLTNSANITHSEEIERRQKDRGQHGVDDEHLKVGLSNSRKIILRREAVKILATRSYFNAVIIRLAD